MLKGIKVSCFTTKNMNNCIIISKQNPFCCVIAFSVYKMLENKATAIDEAKGADVAKEIVREAIGRYKELFAK